MWIGCPPGTASFQSVSFCLSLLCPDVSPDGPLSPCPREARAVPGGRGRSGSVTSSAATGRPGLAGARREQTALVVEKEERAACSLVWEGTGFHPGSAALVRSSLGHRGHCQGTECQAEGQEVAPTLPCGPRALEPWAEPPARPASSWDRACPHPSLPYSAVSQPPPLPARPVCAWVRFPQPRASGLSVTSSEMFCAECAVVFCW